MTLQKIISNKKYLFLDRDGVINKRIMGGYIKTWEEFEFLPGVLDALAIFSRFFDKIIIVTNQQGVGKNVMTKDDLENIHAHLRQEIEKQGGRIDAVYYCTDLRDKKENCRKPGNSMFLKAQEQFPEINQEFSIMIGDTSSDMEFAKNSKMAGILIENENTTEEDKLHADACTDQLITIAHLLK